ncbi:MAG TPA: thiamine diphosphokinase [Candidatus Saccharimonadales bacterium]|nr:thiamine diphosphokinase [Candidatus Saccharimonadales bacterium]
MHYIIFTGGELENGIATEKALKNFDKIIAVDSGASHCLKLKLIPDFLVGDFDSIDQKLLSGFDKTKILRFPATKDETDTELGIQTAVENGATQITILGGISGTRTDHLISNVLLLLKKKFAKAQIKFVDGDQEIYLAKNKIEISGKKRDIISFIPITGTVNKIKSIGLKYDLANYTLSIQGNHGISNELTKPKANVTFPNKTLLVIHTLQ